MAKFSDLLLIVCGTKTLKLKSIKVQHLTTFFRKDFISMQLRYNHLNDLWGPRGQPSIGNGVFNVV